MVDLPLHRNYFTNTLYSCVEVVVEKFIGRAGIEKVDEVVLRQGDNGEEWYEEVKIKPVEMKKKYMNKNTQIRVKHIKYLIIYIYICI